MKRKFNSPGQSANCPGDLNVATYTRKTGILPVSGNWHPARFAETAQRGYGYGCQVAVDLATRLYPALRGYIFYAADGASDPRDIDRIVSAQEQGYPFVLGARTTRLSNWRVMRLSHVIANFA